VFAEAIRQFRVVATEDLRNDPELRRLILPETRAALRDQLEVSLHRRGSVDVPITCLTERELPARPPSTAMQPPSRVVVTDSSKLPSSPADWPAGGQGRDRSVVMKPESWRSLWAPPGAPRASRATLLASGSEFRDGEESMERTA